MNMVGGFMPHGMCFLWRPDILTLHVVSDALIALAYFSIPLMLMRLVRARKDLPFSGAFWMFSIFIVSCGLTHVFAIIVIWHPLYWIEGAIKAVTALASVATAIMLIPILPRALSLRSPAELERVNERLRQSVEESAALLRRYEREHYIATTLQNASIGDIPPSLGTMDLWATYRPGVGDLEIGGDWYDAFQLPDGRVIISIGDVAGKGLNASLIMAKMRQAIRVGAQVQVAPRAILDAADRALRLEYPDALVTAFVAIVDDVESVIVYANAGHPPPLLRLADGSIHELDGDLGLPLGLRGTNSGQTPPDAYLMLRGDSLLVLYTDGLIESTHDYGEGERRLRIALADPSIIASNDVARAIHDAVLHDGARDDVAILVVRFSDDPAASARWCFDSGDASAARATRDALVALLAGRGANGNETFASEVIFGELIGNVLRYAGGVADVQVDWHTGAPVLHVLDRGAGFAYVPGLPADALAESGRGLFIVQQTTRNFTITRRPDGGSHARAGLPLSRVSAATEAARPAKERRTLSTGGGGAVKPIAAS